MIYQNNSQLLSIIRNLGCYFLSLGKIIELETEWEFTPDQINKTWEKSKDLGYINDKNNITNPDGILKLFASWTTRPTASVVQIGEEKQGTTTYWGWVTKKMQVNKYLIEMRLTTGKYGTHFLLVGADKKLIYDSYAFKQYSWIPSGRWIIYNKII